MKDIANVMLERIIDLAKLAGYTPTGNMLVDMQMELMLTRFAYRIAAELKPTEEISEHRQAYSILQDYLIPEDECNSVDFDAVYGRKPLTELLDEIKNRLELKQE